MSDLRKMIRELLSEELAKLEREPEHGIEEESVRIECDADLASFARRLLRLAQDPVMAGKLESGRYVFRLRREEYRNPGQTGQSQAVGKTGISSTPTVEISARLLTERDVARLADSVSAISVNRNARLTPLAGDELRRRGIKILRKSS